MDRKDEVFESASVVVESSISMSELSSPLGAFRVTASAISIDSSGVTSRMKKFICSSIGIPMSMEVLEVDMLKAELGLR
jgi:hypothetical protein